MRALPLPPTLPGGLVFGSGPEAVRDPLGLYTRAQRALGDVVRFRGAPGIHWFLVAPPAGVEQVLKTRQRNYRKPDRFNAPVAALVGNGLIVNEGDSWLRQRRLMQPAFHRQRLGGLVAQMAAAADATAARWEELAGRGAPVDVAAEMLRTTLRVVGTTMFSADLGRDADRVGTATRVALEEVSWRMTRPLSAPLWLPTARNRRFRAGRAVIDAAVRETIRERRRDGGDRGDLLSTLLAAQDADTGERMSDEQVRDEVLTLMLAGHETTASALSWTWHLLGRNPAAAAWMRAELDAVLAGRTPGMDDLARLPRTRAVFKETLRLFPPAWGQPREAVEEDEIGGFRIPAGALLLVSQYVTQRRPDLWERPDDFVPARFADGAPAVPPFAYFPFGGGARQCIGSHFAVMEAQVILATLAQRFAPEPVPGHTVEPDATFALRPRGALPMTLRARSGGRVGAG